VELLATQGTKREKRLVLLEVRREGGREGERHTLSSCGVSSHPRNEERATAGAAGGKEGGREGGRLV
jgi:hypothetical protein